MHKQATPTVRNSAKSPTRSKSLPQKYFVSTDVFTTERENIFSRNWLLVGHQSQVAGAGDYIAQDVNGDSLIVIRDKSGDIHGFFNVCRHRGSRLIEHRQGETINGNCAAIQCPYHAWTFALDGRLAG